MLLILRQLLLKLLLTALLLAGPAGALAAEARPVILILGDSISAAYGINTEQGWVALLQQRLNGNNDNYRVVNISVSGDTTRTGLNRLSPALQQHQPAIVVVALGGNDGLRGLSFDEISGNLGRIIQLSRQQGARVLLAGIRLPPNYGPAYNARFDGLFRELATRHQTGLVPLLLDQVDVHPELMQDDRIHPNAGAQAQILENVWPHLQPLL